MVSGSDGGLTPFDRDKLFVTIYESCKHRPNALSESASLAKTVISKVLGANKQAVISSGDIVEATLYTLKRFDQTAAVIYEAYHAS